MTSKNENFHFDEMVWRGDSGLINQAVTELTAIKDDVEFEKRIFLIRFARQVSGLGNKQLHHRTTRLFGNLIQIVLLNICRPFLLILEFALSKGEITLGFVHKRIRKVTCANPNEEIVVLLPKLSLKSGVAKLLPDFIGKWRIGAKCDRAFAVRSNHRIGGNNFGNFHAVIIRHWSSIRTFVKTICKRQQHQSLGVAAI